jgi:hypothetical protein
MQREMLRSGTFRIFRLEGDSPIDESRAGVNYPMLRRIHARSPVISLAHLEVCLHCPKSFISQRKGDRISRRTSPQDSNVLRHQAEARLQLGVIEVEEPHADALLAGIIPGPNESADEA